MIQGIVGYENMMLSTLWMIPSSMGKASVGSWRSWRFLWIKIPRDVESRVEKKEKTETQEVFKSREVSTFPCFLVEKQTPKHCQECLKKSKLWMGKCLSWCCSLPTKILSSVSLVCVQPRLLVIRYKISTVSYLWFKKNTAYVIKQSVFL